MLEHASRFKKNQDFMVNCYGYYWLTVLVALLLYILLLLYL